MKWVIHAVIAGWTSVHFVSHNAGSLWTQFITFLDVKSSFSKAFFSLNYIMKFMISTDNKNKIRNENPGSTGSLAGSKRFFSTFHLSSTRMNLLHQSRHVGSRPGFRQKSLKLVKSVSQTARTCRKPGRKPGRKPDQVFDQVCSWLE